MRTTRRSSNQAIGQYIKQAIRQSDNQAIKQTGHLTISRSPPASTTRWTCRFGPCPTARRCSR
eukprot:6368631-Prymnesium_polylepis.2